IVAGRRYPHLDGRADRSGSASVEHFRRGTFRRMSATVHDIWAGALPPGTQLVGGQRGLGREVRWVVTLRPRPPGLVGLKGGELVLVGADTLRALDDRLTLSRALDQLAQAGVAAVAARGGIDQSAIARSDALGF